MMISKLEKGILPTRNPVRTKQQAKRAQFVLAH